MVDTVLANEKTILRKSWYKAVTVSLLLHCLLVLGIGWKVTDHPLTPKEEQNLEVDFVPIAAEMAVETTVAAEATDSESAAESVPAKTITTEPKNKTPERQPTAQGSGKNVPALKMTNYNNEQLEMTLAKYNLLLTVNSVAIIYHDRGKIYYDKGELDKAFADFSQALTLDPLLSPARIGRGFIYLGRNQWNLALDDFNQAIAASPKNALAYYGRALYFINNNDKPKAINDLQSVIQYAPPEHKKLIESAQQKLEELRE